MSILRMNYVISLPILKQTFRFDILLYKLEWEDKSVKREREREIAFKNYLAMINKSGH